jgi:protein gp37
LVAYLTRDVEVIRKNGDKVKIPAGTRGWFCTKCSPGCLHCYAEKINLRLGNGLTYQVKNLDEIEFRLVNLDAPLRWRKPGFVFVNSMTDLFHEAVPWDLIDQIFGAIANSPKQTFQILTKRATRMREYFEMVPGKQTPCGRIYDAGSKIQCSQPKPRYNLWTNHIVCFPMPLPNVWLGVSAENQKYWNERVAELVKTPAAVRFVSAEPLLGPIDINGTGTTNRSNKIDWVIVGGESGASARPMHPNWARGLRNQCVAELIKFFFKQWGEFKPTEEIIGHSIPDADPRGLHRYMDCVGKKRAGRLLDGREWNEMPEVANGKA